MTLAAPSLMKVYEGWNGYQVSLVRAIVPLSQEQLAWRPAPHLRSVGEVASHIIYGRIHWFHRVLGAGSAEFASQVAAWRPEEAIEGKAAELVKWLETTWKMIEEALTRWTADDLWKTYSLPYEGKTYAVSRQWIIWRIISHDIHHGGELAIMLGTQGIVLPELGDLGGHIIQPPLAEASSQPKEK